MPTIPATLNSRAVVRIDSNSYNDAWNGTPDSGVGVFPAGDLELRNYYWPPFSSAQIYQSFVEFDTSTIGDPAGYRLEMPWFPGYICAANTVEARLYDYGTSVDVADFRNDVTTPAYFDLPLVATLTFADFFSADDHEFLPFDDVALVANINTTGFTRLVIGLATYGTPPAPLVDVADPSQQYAFYGPHPSTDPAMWPRLRKTDPGWYLGQVGFG